MDIIDNKKQLRLHGAREEEGERPLGVTDQKLVIEMKLNRQPFTKIVKGGKQVIPAQEGDYIKWYPIIADENNLFFSIPAIYLRMINNSVIVEFSIYYNGNSRNTTLYYYRDNENRVIEYNSFGGVRSITNTYPNPINYQFSIIQDDYNFTVSWTNIIIKKLT